MDKQRVKIIIIKTEFGLMVIWSLKYSEVKRRKPKSVVVIPTAITIQKFTIFLCE